MSATNQKVIKIVLEGWGLNFICILIEEQMESHDFNYINVEI